MRFVGTLLLLAGYTLLYGSVANGGKFATNPWAGLFTDAYPKPQQQQPQQGMPGQPPMTRAPIRPRASAPTPPVNASVPYLPGSGSPVTGSKDPLTIAGNILKKILPFPIP